MGASPIFCATGPTAASRTDAPADATPSVAEASGPSSDGLPDAPSAFVQHPAQEKGLSAADLTPEKMEAARREAHRQSEAEHNTACETANPYGEDCSVQWMRVLGESFLFLSAQHSGNIAMDKDTRYNLTHGDFWDDYVYCVKHYRWSRWKDDDPFSVDYIGHPMMGAVTNYIYEQNDPKQRALTFENTHRYWMGRLRATAYSAVYSAQWKVGPLSEASIGNTGIGYYYRDSDGLSTNETGMQDFFVTPLGGLAWNVGEDLVDKHFFRHVQRAHPHNKVLLSLAAFTTPTRAGANLLRFRPLYYRDFDKASLAAMPK